MDNDPTVARVNVVVCFCFFTFAFLMLYFFFVQKYFLKNSKM